MKVSQAIQYMFIVLVLLLIMITFNCQKWTASSSPETILTGPWHIRASSEVESQGELISSTDYEMEGFFGGVIFSCGADVREDGRVTIYYGAADECMCAATTTVDELLASLK